jgi:hypothetical protein
LLNRQDCLRGSVKAAVQWKDRSGEVQESMGVDALVHRVGYGENYVRVYYTRIDKTTKEKEDFDYKISLFSEPCNFGGKRFWFICPLIVNGIPCDRTVGKLYLPSNGKYFGCRHCYNLTYRSCKRHNKRLDWIRKLPYTSFKRIMESGNPKMVLLGIKATLKNL